MAFICTKEIDNRGHGKTGVQVLIRIRSDLDLQHCSHVTIIIIYMLVTFPIDMKKTVTLCKRFVLKLSLIFFIANLLPVPSVCTVYYNYTLVIVTVPKLFLKCQEYLEFILTYFLMCCNTFRLLLLYPDHLAI
jgi:hypothetical protein